MHQFSSKKIIFLKSVNNFLDLLNGQVENWSKTLCSGDKNVGYYWNRLMQRESDIVCCCFSPVLTVTHRCGCWLQSILAAV